MQFNKHEAISGCKFRPSEFAVRANGVHRLPEDGEWVSGL